MPVEQLSVDCCRDALQLALNGLERIVRSRSDDAQYVADLTLRKVEALVEDSKEESRVRP